jgi:2'-5' RNA ligase
LSGPRREDGDAAARVFVGLALGAELGRAAAALVAGALADPRGRAWRLPRAEGLHLTLLFLGDVPRPRLPALGATLGDALAGRPAPEVVLDHAGAFPRRGEERVLWLGASEAAGAEGRLADLHRRALGAVRAAGLDPGPDADRPLHPHVTVARPRRERGRAVGRAPDAFFALAPGLAWRPDEVVLFESTRAPDGPPEYVPRAAVPLAAR